MAVHDIVMAAAGAATAPGDDYFKYVSLLLTGNGTNGAQNNTFLDSSTNNFTITRNGNATQGTFSPYGTNWSNYFDGSGDYLSVPNNTNFEILGSSFTIECWVNLNTAVSSSYGIISKHDGSGGYILRYSSTGLVFYTTAATASITYSFNLNQWYHIAVSSNGTTGTVYINGVAQGSTFSTNGTQDTTSTVQIGRTHTVTNDFPGYISNVRIVKGTAVYTSGFTPSATPLTAISGTSLLTCQSNRFIDNSSNAFAITANGNTAVQRFSPFNPTAAYSSAAIGGSAYFDGTGDYLSLTGTALSTDIFTCEAWVYLTALTGYQTIHDSRPSGGSSTGFTLQIGPSGTIEAYSGGTMASTSTALAVGSWYHVAFVRNTGGSCAIYINGVSSGTGSNSSNLTSTSISIGKTPDNYYFNGFISNLRIVKGTAVYTTGFTPPTAPVTAISGTSLLVNSTNAGIPDAAMQNDLETIGNAQVSTSVKKYGTGSLAFDGTSDWLQLLTTSNITLGSGAFTLEGWIYLNTVSGAQIIFDQRPASSQGVYPVLYMNGASMTWYVDSAARISSSNLSTGTWYHFAIVRSSGSTKLYINGTQSGSTYSDSSAYLASKSYIGISAYDETGGLNGYIDDFRITKGYARYTSNFTAPTAAFPTY